MAETGSIFWGKAAAPKDQSIVERKGFRQMLLNTETHDAKGGLRAAIERSKQGFGTVVFCSHNAKNDMVAALTMLKKVPEFKDKEFVLPINSMLYKAYWPGEKLLGIKLMPVHSPEVRRKHVLAKDKTTRKELSAFDRILVPKEEYLDVETSLQQYLAASKQALEHGGIVLVAPQAQGNLDKLDMTHQRRAFSKFWNYMNQFPELQYSVLPMGVSYPESAQKGKPQKGAHIGERMRIDIGSCYKSESIGNTIATSGVNPDLWMYQRVAELLPQAAVKTAI